MSRLIKILLICSLILPAILSLARPGFFSMYDDMQVIRLEQMDECIKDGQIPCRWVPQLGYGYGYPLFMYYAPLPYYSMEAIHSLGFSFIDSVKIGFGLSVLLSGAFFYLYLRYLIPHEASIFATLVYVYAPFRAADMYVRGAMGELWGLFALPFVLWGFERLLKKSDKISVGIFGLSIGIYLITHNLTVLMTLPLILSWILLRILFLRKKAPVKMIFLGGLVGISLSSFYWLPLIWERNLVWLETLTQGYFNYLAHFISLKQIFVSVIWGYGPSIAGPMDEAMLGVGPIGLVLAFLGTIVGINSKKKEVKLISIFFAFFFLVGAFLSHGRSAYIWEKLKFIQYLQFPWRFIFVATFASAVLGGIYVSKFKSKVIWSLIFVLIIGIYMIYGNYFKPKDWFYLTDEQKLSGELLERQLTASIYDYLPKSAEKAPTSKAPDTLIIQEGDVSVTYFEKGTNWYKVQAFAQGDASVALPSYDFPDWSVKINGEIQQTIPTGELGLVGLKIAKGEVSIEAVLTNSLSRKIGDLLSIIGIVSLISLLGYEKVNSKVFNG